MFHVKQSSGLQHVYIGHGKPVMQGKIDAIAYQLGNVAHRGVDIPRRNEHAGGVR